ncbi:PREDICTED: putative F-box protein At5g40050 [Camelina sativa]|uniref:F-box protein At5g40050 n=1 Tax=Camelina sativa TaxID=90675 RepID=A0ABM0V4Q8_CAMSA|nr:PREDICTED: putative F-box protein At5g40050 [Camelina sativa]
METKSKKVSLLSDSVDSISSLPDEILAHILSFLPTKRAASTSILSKRWRTLFHIMNLLCSSLDLDDSDLLYPESERHSEDVSDSFRDFVDKTLSVCNNNSLKKFSLKFQDDDVHHIGLTTTRRWISKALEHGLSDLDLRIKMPLMHKPPPLLPNTLYINNTLVKLTLGTELCLGKSPWKELEELYIHHIYIRDRDCEFGDLSAPHFIDHDNIKKLTVHYNNGVKSPRVLFIYTPSLVYLDYSDYLTCLYQSEDRFDDLLEARLNLVFPRNGRWGYEHGTCLKIVNSISSLQILYLSSSTVENLATLHFEGNKKEYWKLLCNMIEKAPKLETLVLNGLCGISDCGVNINGGNVVKVVEIQGYKGNLEELNQVKCFLREMENLEEMKVNIRDETDNKLKLTNDLLALPKRSSKCNIHVL